MEQKRKKWFGQKELSCDTVTMGISVTLREPQKLG
jgi:hypothetical protein